ncbi:MAG: hypothetical protein R3E79_32025 [Caldilineaceae bacterium]
MSDTVIKVENLSKSYLIRHQASAGSGTERYTALPTCLPMAPEPGQPPALRPASSQQPPATSEVWALNDVSFEVKQGERVGIPSAMLRTSIGRNGAGKSVTA